MSWRKRLQPNNPSEKILESYESRILSIERELIELQIEKRNQERFLNDHMSDLYVLARKGEKLEDHLAEVEYSNGYYQSLEEALKDTVEFLEGWVIYNLHGEVIKTSP